ncbi:MAG: hypothetical protein VXW29_09720, partial [SAR324 cluster bacterium]|nr:hypothetical protein [SAR324 cluster bacterium]
TVSAGATSLSPAEKTALKEKAKQIKAKSLRSFFLTLGFPVVLADNATDNTTVVAIPLKVPPTVEDTDLPGAATFGDRSIRHFLVKGNNTSVAPTGWESAPLLATQVDVLLDNLTGYITDNVTNEAQLISDNKSDRVDRVRVFHRFERAIKEGMPLVSKELVDWMVDYDNKTVTIQDVATQIAKITEWRQERIVFANGMPVFTGDFSAPSTGSTVKASALITALTRPLGTDAKTTAADLTDGNENFWVPFAAEALAEQIMRNAADLQSGVLNFSAILPKTSADYKKFLTGLSYTTFSGSTKKVPPSPAYMDARATIARGLVAALPDDAYSTASQKKTINGQTQLNAKQAIFVITYLLELQFAVEKAQGLLLTEADGKILPNIENFKSLSFTSDVGVAQVTAAMMAVTGPSEGNGFNFAQSQLRSGGLLVGARATNGLAGMLLPEFKEFNAAEVGISSNTTATIKCKVKMFDGSTPSGLSVNLLQYNNDLEEFAAATKIDNTTISFSTSDNQTFTASAVPTQQEYAIRFKIDSYRNDLPELFFWADEFSAQIDVCGPEGFVIGPDVEDKPLPGAGLFASSSTTDAEGLDFSNYTEPGKFFVLFPGEDVSNGGS